MAQIITDRAYSMYVEAKAFNSGLTASDIKTRISEEQFLNSIRGLHEQFMDGEFSQGYFAELLGVQRL